MSMRIEFDVHGGDEEQLWAEARRELAKFTADPDRWCVTIDASPGIEMADGRIAEWIGRVLALSPPRSHSDDIPTFRRKW